MKRKYEEIGKDPEVSGKAPRLRKLRPYLAGIVTDEVANVGEITSTIVDLAIRGYLHIREIKEFLKKEKVLEERE